MYYLKCNSYPKDITNVVNRYSFLSQLDTPPSNRMPVQTYVIEKNFSLIKEVIQRELARGGQVFYLYNNVREIFNVARKLKQVLPDVEIGVAHGKMTKEELKMLCCSLQRINIKFLYVRQY